MKKNTLYALIIIIACFIVFANTLDNEFVWDDKAFILEDSDIKDLSNTKSFFTEDVQGLYRPLRTFFYAISYQLWGEFLFYYHIQAILIHTICSVLVYFIFLRILKKKNISLLAALLFAVHPIHTEAISFITASFDQIAIIFLLASFLLYIKGKKISPIIFYILAVFSSEIAIILPFLIILYDFTFKLKFNKGNLIKKIKTYLPYIIIFIGFLFIRFFLIKVFGRVDLESLGWSYSLRLLNMPKFILKYILLLIWPLNLTVKHHIVISSSLFDMSLFIPIILIIALIIFSVNMYNKSKVIFFSIWFFFISLLPVSNIIPIQRLMTEAYVYLASIGFVLFIAYLINKIPEVNIKGIEKKELKKISLGIFVLLILVFSFITINRNKDWQNEQTLWESTIEVNPYSATAFNNLGLVYQQQGDYKGAGQSFIRSLELNEDRAITHYNLGVLYAQLNMINDSTNAYEMAVDLDPNLAKAYLNLGINYDIMERYEGAYNAYSKALELNPNFEVYLNLGNHFDRVKEYDKAIENYDKAITLNPDNVLTYYNLGIVYLKKNEFDEAKIMFLKVLEINPDFYPAEEKILQLDDLGLI